MSKSEHKNALQNIAYLEVLLAQREVLETKLELVETKKEQLVTTVSLYHALSGGW